MNNSRFSTAVFILALLAIEQPSGPLTSDYLARSASTNAVVIRRLVSALRKAGLVRAQVGAGGGVTLALEPRDIPLLAVYRAVGAEDLFALGSCDQNPYCVCARNIGPVLGDVIERAHAAVEQTLAGVTVAEVAADITRRDAARANG